FIVKSFNSPYKCNLCTSLLVGLQRQGITCEVCGYSCHIACMDKVPKQCPVPPELMSRPYEVDVDRGQGTAYDGFVR
ncbi:serine/threonine-protein kinase MRCK alpha, partial [Elysia marginata]